MKDPKYLLTVLEGFPIIIKCTSQAMLAKHRKKRAVTISEGVFKKNLKHWTDRVTNPEKQFIVDVINQHFGDEDECWIRKEDAQ